MKVSNSLNCLSVMALVLFLFSCGGGGGEAIEPNVDLGAVSFESNNSNIYKVSIYSDTQIDSIELVNTGNTNSASDLEFSIASSNQTLLPDENMSLNGTEKIRQITFIPATGETGKTILTGTVTNKTTNESINCTLPLNVLGQSLDGHLFPAANSRDMIHNTKNNTLYISNDTEILQYDMASGALLDTIVVGGQLLGLDINLDYSQIAVADNTVADSQVSVHLIDTLTHGISQLSFSADFMESGTYSVAYTSDNNLVSTSTLGGSGWVPLRHVDIDSEVVLYERSVRQSSMLSANPDDTLIAFSESNISGGPYGIYDYNSLTMSLTDRASSFLYDIAIDRTNSYLAIPTAQGLRIFDTSGNLITMIPASTYGAPLGVAYNPVDDLLYVSWANSSTVGVFNSLTHDFIENINIPYTMSWHGNWGMSDGHIKISDDGTQALLQVPGGIYSFRTSVRLGIALSLLVSP